MTKEPAANNKILWTVEFEKERLSYLKCTELRISRGLPKIDFIRFLGRKEAEPIGISYGYEEVQVQSPCVSIDDPELLSFSKKLR
jgi:hypothetical protein